MTDDIKVGINGFYTEAYYAQIAYEINDFKPYARFEYTHYDHNDFYF